ncbi:hypothetical protein [uncultured Litoreibacter sp.]|uniref:hypothetical protein n=1 Tax=uncultured Litoreibacter sp. TaxID=1392394 RepID=UPI002612648F|nr:hypothetical protein [uncultured Litoreibacter sp.]
MIRTWAELRDFAHSLDLPEVTDAVSWGIQPSRRMASCGAGGRPTLRPEFSKAPLRNAKC